MTKKTHMGPHSVAQHCRYIRSRTVFCLSKYQCDYSCIGIGLSLWPSQWQSWREKVKEARYPRQKSLFINSASAARIQKLAHASLRSDVTELHDRMSWRRFQIKAEKSFGSVEYVSMCPCSLAKWKPGQYNSQWEGNWLHSHVWTSQEYSRYFFRFI